MYLRLEDFQLRDLIILQNEQKHVLAYHTGMGKTVVALSAIIEGPVLVVAPKHILVQWEYMIKEWTPRLKSYYLLDRLRGGFDDNGVYLINYAMIWRKNVAVKIRNLKHKTLILDEGHFLFNRKSKRSQTVKRLARRSKYIFILTATPDVHRPERFWHLLHLVDSPTFSSYWKFFNRHVAHWVHPQSGARIPTGIRDKEEYHKEIEPYVTIRTRDMITVPRLTKRTNWVTMDKKQSKAYSLVEKGQLEDEYGAIGIPNILALNTLLRKLATSQTLVTGEESLDCSKIDVLLSLISGIETKALIFTHFRASKKMVSKALEAKGYTVANVDSLDTWLKGNAQFLVDTFYKGGLGLNLQEASDSIFFEPPNGYIPHVQSIGRLQRMGSPHKAQFIWRLCVNDTIEPHIWRQLDRQGHSATESSIAIEAMKSRRLELRGIQTEKIVFRETKV